MEFETVRAMVDGIPHMDPVHGRIIYDHIRETKPSSILELGSANGVSAAYMAAALEANGGEGKILSVDIDRANYVPGPIKLFEQVGLQHRVEFVRVPDSSYNWLLRTQVRQRSDDQGNCAPLYEFVFIDGPHELNIDGLGAVLVEKLLKPGGWLLLDDLDWSYGTTNAIPPFHLSQEELDTPPVREIFDLIVKQNPVFTEFRNQDGHWGWAKKEPGQPRRITIESTENLASIATRNARVAVRAVRARWVRRRSKT